MHFNPLPHTRENSVLISIQPKWCISIHSLIRGRTILPRSVSDFPKNFNPLPHTRENYNAKMREQDPFISIHSLIRGRTRERGSIYFGGGYFNPLPHTRENEDAEFSTDGTYNFNPLPHTRENSDAELNGIAAKFISIHSLIRGRTRSVKTPVRIGKNFNPLPHTRENCKMSQWLMLYAVSLCDNLT